MKHTKKLLAIFLAILMTFSCLGVASAEVIKDVETKGEPVSSFPFVTISDIHYYPETLIGNRSDDWFRFCRLESKCYNESEAIIRNTLDNVMARNDGSLKYILVPGDLTKDSEYEAHTELAKIFREYTEKYGVKFIVTNGNHDINVDDACSFANDVKEPARAITAAEFAQVYSEFGFADAINRYAYPEKGDEIQGALSYVYDLDDNYRLIVVDSCEYDFGNVPQKQQTGGMVTPELMQWIHGWADKSKADGKTPFIMVHHNMAPHMEVEPSITFAFVLDDYLDVAEQWADWGIHYTFTGHLHTNDTASVTSDSGNVLYDLESDSVTGFPNQYRENIISTYADGTSSMTTDAIDFDSDVPFSFDGVTYEKGTYKNKSFNLCFGGGIADDGIANLTDFLVGTVKAYAGSYITGIAEAGGIVNFLKTMDIDLEGTIAGFLEPYIGDGIKIGNKKVISVDNVMWFIRDLDEQITSKYINNPDVLYGIITDAVSKLATLEVSDLSCTKFIDTIGFGSEERKGNLGDLALTAMYYWYTGNEEADKDEFLLDAISKLETGDTCKKLFDTALDAILNGIVLDELLSNIDVRIETLLGNKKITYPIRQQIKNLEKLFLKKDLSFRHLVDVFFELEILPYKNVMDALDGYLLSEYLTDSQFEGTGTFIAYILKDFAMDNDPEYMSDFDTTYTSDKVDVPATQSNYRIPTEIAVTLGEDAQTQANINFYSKSTLKGEIEIYKADSEPTFSGIPTTNADFNIDIDTKTVTRSFPGIDLGGFGLFNYDFKINQTTVKLSNLEPNSTYYFRVGDSEHGWWSKTGSIKTADADKSVTFIHATDPQSLTVPQYSRSWKNVLNTAYGLYPDAAFTLSTGDLVDHGDNNKLWQMMFDTADDILLNTYLMSASGNHEGKGTDALANHFVLPNAPKQDTTSGVYYSFDYNNIHVAVLNTNDINDKNELSSEQISWLKDDMKHSDAQWKFVSLHKAIYSNGSHFDDKDVQAIRKQLQSLMPQLGIDMVFQGHDHVYLRTGVMDNNKVVGTDTQYLIHNGSYFKSFIQPKGTIYEIAGTSGVKTYTVKDASVSDKQFPRAEKSLAVDDPMFAAIEIEDGVLYFTAYEVTGENKAVPVDRIAIQKDITQGEVDPDYVVDEFEEIINTPSGLKTFFNTLQKIMKVISNLMKVIFRIPEIKLPNIEIKC